MNQNKALKKEIANFAQICLSQVKPVPVFMDELFPIVAGIIEKIENENPGNYSGVLIFVPGLAEIQELQSYLSRYFLNKTTLEFLILHSQISDDEQDMVFADYQGKRKIILATNIAESSITISNIDFVIDFCLVKQTRFDEYQNTSILELKWCSKSSIQQRKGRTGRTNKGFYFRLITKRLYEKLTDHPKAEILRTPLETPILKLKIYEPTKEPQDILMKTIEPPEEDKIINTLFRLEKMGALIKGKVQKDDYNSLSMKKKVNYKSGVITTIGKIFAELPIDIKYSRLIMISYALGEIELGITLAAILSQERPIFLSSEKISTHIYRVIIEYSGGYFQLFLVFIFAVVWQFTIIEGNIYLAKWSEKIDINSEDENIYNFMIYTLFGIVCIFSLFLKEFLISKMNFNLSKNFHDKMLQNIIDAPINLYFDITPFGQIMNKFTIDLDKCVLFFRHFSATLKYLCTLIGSIIVCVSSNYYVLFFLPFVFLCGYKMSVYYAPAGRDILRIESIDRSPLLSFYSESIQGIDTIKSLKYYDIDKFFFKKFSEKLLGHFSIFLYKFGTRTFFELILDLLSVIFVLFLFIYCIIFHTQFNSITISLLLKFSLSISEDILVMLTHGTELENSFVRVERCESATHLPKENFGNNLNEVNNKNKKEIFNGNIEMEHVFIKYRNNLDYILKDITLNISSGEKVCVVGRTGSGKSTIILALFRLIESNKGNIYINKKNIREIPLKILRRNLGIVPQEPKIFSGSLKFNLDPMEKYSDFEINNAIREVGLFKLMKENGRDIRKKLRMKLKENGGNL